jgi:hypothetical protein
MTERSRAGSIEVTIRRSRPRVGLAVAICAGLLALSPGVAAAAPVNRASDRVALEAYHSYLQDLVSIVPTWRNDDNAYIASISARCSGVLHRLKHAATGTYNQDAVLVFGEESGGDLDAVVYPSARPALADLAAKVSSLRWSSSGIRKVITTYIGAERSLFNVAPSNLCADARVLASSHGRAISRRTAAWVVRYSHRVTAATRDGAAFITVLARYVTPSERGLVRSTTHLLDRFDSAVKAEVVPEVKKLVGVLGL